METSCYASRHQLDRSETYSDRYGDLLLLVSTPTAIGLEIYSDRYGELLRLVSTPTAIGPKTYSTGYGHRARCVSPPAAIGPRATRMGMETSCYGSRHPRDRSETYSGGYGDLELLV